MEGLKKRKIIYVPGLISLTILPILFLFWTNKNFESKSFRVLKVYLADTNQFRKYPEIYSNYIKEFPPKRNYLDIVFTGNNIEDKIKLDFARIQIKEYVLQKDYTKCIHFKFGDSCEYWTFVKTIDALNSQGARTFAPLDNDIWFFNIKPDTTIKTLNYPCLLYNDVIFVEPEKTSWTKTVDRLLLIWKSSWTIIVAFCSFIFAVLLLRRKKNGS